MSTANTNPHISEVRALVMAQMKALRQATKPEDVQLELDKAKGIARLTEVLVESARVEVAYLELTDQSSTPFLEVPPDAPYLIPQSDGQSNNGIRAITRHRMK